VTVRLLGASLLLNGWLLYRAIDPVRWRDRPAVGLWLCMGTIWLMVVGAGLLLR
jgi:hypothetical protein